MKSPLKWVGGKSRLVETILPLIPQHAHYAEAFCGAGWLFFRKPESRYESINDINKDLTTFYRVLKHHLHPFVEEFRWMLTSREFFEDFQNQQKAGGLTDIQRAARFYYLQRCAFGGQVTNQSFGVSPNHYPPINLLRLEEELSAIHLRMTRVIVENLSWQDYISRYDRPETFFYLDPPYWDTEDYYGKNIFSKADYTQMAKTLATIQGKFLLSINDTPQIRTIFAGFRVQEAKTTYTCAKDGSTNAAELLIMNYEPKPGMLRLF